MSVSVKELLELPSLREATVVTGQRSLDRRVTSLSFLEVSDMTFFSDNIQVGDEYYASELLIGSFYTIRHDVPKQCEAIRHLHQLGEIGIILYYVGIVLPELSPEVVALADELAFVIIQMPKNDSSLRYNEVVIEVMSAILSSKPPENLLNDVLEKVSLLPEQQRSVEITLKMLSDLLRVNVVLTDSENEIINQVMWPRNSSLAIFPLLNSGCKNQPVSAQQGGPLVYRREFFHKDNGRMQLYLIKEKGELSATVCEQAVEVLQVALNFWGQKHGAMSEYALVQAILNDESEKMYRLAKVMNIDVRGIQLMWLIQLQDTKAEKLIRQELTEHVSKYYGTSVIQFVDGGIIALLGNYLNNHGELEISNEYLQETAYAERISNVVFCPRQRNTTDVRQNYLLVTQSRRHLGLVFPERKTFSLAEIRHLQQALEKIQGGEQEIEAALQILEPILQQPEYLTTLSTFLLDANSDFHVCSERLFIHKNTVKYRLKKISEQLGYNVLLFSESYDCYLACMIYRLLY